MHVEQAGLAPVEAPVVPHVPETTTGSSPSRPPASRRPRQRPPRPAASPRLGRSVCAAFPGHARAPPVTSEHIPHHQRRAAGQYRHDHATRTLTA